MNFHEIDDCELLGNYGLLMNYVIILKTPTTKPKTPCANKKSKYQKRICLGQNVLILNILFMYMYPAEGGSIKSLDD